MRLHTGAVVWWFGEGQRPEQVRVRRGVPGGYHVETATGRVTTMRGAFAATERDALADWRDYSIAEALRHEQFAARCRDRARQAAEALGDTEVARG